MATMSTVAATMFITNPSPMKMAMSLLMVSVTIAPAMTKEMSSSWIPLIVILTFSSGMMTMFIYASAILPNKKQHPKKLWTTTTLLTAMAMQKETNMKKASESMKSFSMNNNLMIMAMILMITLVNVSNIASSPTQPMQSSY